MRFGCIVALGETHANFIRRQTEVAGSDAEAVWTFDVKIDRQSYVALESFLGADGF